MVAGRRIEARAHRREQSMARWTAYGACAGIGGGLVFGLTLTALMPGAMQALGRIIAVESVTGGWIYHLFNSAVIGALFGLVLGGLPVGYLTGALWGGLYGLAWWVLGGLVLMPLMMGFPDMVLSLGSSSPVGLLGHAAFGVITGTGFVILRGKRP